MKEVINVIIISVLGLFSTMRLFLALLFFFKLPLSAKRLFLNSSKKQAFAVSDKSSFTITFLF